MRVRILYRVRQFWRTVFLKTDPNELAQVQGRLSPAQWVLFTRLQPAEQGHALRMYRKLLQQGENQPELLVAALLHDVGKLRHRLNPVERTMVVLVKAVKPELALRWGSLPPGGWEKLPKWRKAFILTEQHASWGAEMAQQAGVTPLTESLIREHHHPPGMDAGDTDNSLRHKLWVVDNEN